MDPPSHVDPDVVVTHQIVAGRYRLDRSLGASRMAEVFVATDTLLRRPVAVKRLPTAAMQDATAEARFAREARALARVNDPSVVTVFDVVVDDGRPFLVMELVDGMTLRQLIDRDGRLEPARIVSIASGICSGLAAVHERGIVHRDMKPSNVFLTRSGAVKIGDFGIASVASDVTLTRAGEVFGSAPYVSPEQVSGDPVDARTDLYSLGCVMFEMATGRPPFVGDEPAALAYHHVHTTPERVDSLVPQVPAALAATIDRSLAKDPADRPESAAELRDALEAIPTASVSDVGDAPTQPLPPPTATDVLPMAPSTPPREPSRPSWPPLWVALLALGIVLLLIVNALDGGSTVDAQTPVGHRSPSSAASASSAPSGQSPTPTATGGSSTEEATAALIALIDSLGSSEAVDAHLAKDLQHGLDEVVQAVDQGDGGKALDAIGRFQDKVDKGVEHGEISTQDAQRLRDALDALAGTMGDGDEGGGGEGD